MSLGYQMALSIDYYDKLAMVSHWNFTIKFIRGYKVILVTAILHFLAHLWIATSITLLSFVAPSVIVSTKRWNHKSFTDVLSPVAIHLCVLQFFKILIALTSVLRKVLPMHRCLNSSVLKLVQCKSRLNPTICSWGDPFHSWVKSWTSRASGRKTMQARFRTEAFG